MIKMILVTTVNLVHCTQIHEHVEDIFVLIPLYWYKSGNEDKPYHLFIVNIIYP